MNANPMTSNGIAKQCPQCALNRNETLPATQYRAASGIRSNPSDSRHDQT